MPPFELPPEKLDKLHEFLARYSSRRPKPERNLDQFRATEETVLRRVLLLGRTKGLAHQRLLFLGDSDLTSLAFGLFCRANRVTVVDKDQRLLSFMAEVASEMGFPLELVEHDLREPFGQTMSLDYDVVFFDPPYTPQAVNVWLLRAAEASLGKGRNKKRKRPETLAAKWYYLCYGYTERSMERGLKIQQIITSLGLIIQEKLKGFSQYQGAKAIGSKSDLYVIQPTPLVDIRKLDVARSQFYTGQTEKGKDGPAD